MDGPFAVIRTDPVKALGEDSVLQKHKITLEIGHAKNPNKNHVAEKAILELENELLRLDPCGAVTPLTLAIATAALNSRIRTHGLSAREMRNQFSNEQLPVQDDLLIIAQHSLCTLRTNSSFTSAGCRGLGVPPL